jgi:hypothetical protein
MNLREFKTLLLSQTPGRTVLPDETSLIHSIQTAVIQVAHDTLPLRLARIERPTQVLRKIDKEMYIRMPIRAILDTDQIDSDELLMSAVAYFTNSIVEQQKKGTHLNAYEKEIKRNNERLIETELSVCESQGGPNGSSPYV